MFTRFLPCVAVLLLLVPGLVHAQDSTATNPFETLFRGLRQVAQDTTARQEAESKAQQGLGQVLNRLRTMVDSSEAARERVTNMQLMTPDSIEAIVSQAQRRIETTTQELKAENLRMYATRVRTLPGDRLAGTDRLGPMHVVGSLLDRGIPNGRGILDAEVTSSGALYFTGGYSRHAIIADTPVRSVESPLSTDTVAMERTSSLTADWLLNGSGMGSSTGMNLEPAPGGAYVLGLSQGGPTQVGDFTVEHEKGESLSYIARLDDTGETRWVVPLAQPIFDLAAGTMTATPDGRIYVGYFLESMYGVPVASNQNPTTGEATYSDRYTHRDSATGATMTDRYTRHQLLAAYAPDGTQLWQHVSENATVTELETGPGGALYAVGHFTESSPLCGGIETTQDQAAFVARFAADGTCNWIQTTSGSMIPLNNAGNERTVPGDANSFRALALGPDGDVYVTGSFLGRTDFGGHRLHGETELGTGLVARLDAADGTVLWVQPREMVYPPEAPDQAKVMGHVYGDDLAVDDTGGLYLVESVNRWAMVDGTSSVVFDLRVVSMNTDGRVRWEALTGVSAQLVDYVGHKPAGVRLVEAPSGPPYLMVQDPAFEMEGRTIPAAGDGVRPLALGRLGPGSSSGR